MYSLMGNYNAAVSLYERALDIQEDFGGKNHPEYAANLNELAVQYNLKGDFYQAESLMRQALNIAYQTLLENHPTIAIYLANLAVQCAAVGKAGEALEKMEQALDADFQMIGQVFAFSSENQRMQFQATLQRNIDLFLSLLLQFFSTSPHAIRTGLELTLRRKGLGAAAVITLRDAIRTLLMSLWKVDDEWTMRLMTCFYKRLMEGQACAEALRSAQLAIKAQKPHPYFWSPFICQGDPSALSQYQRTTQI